MNGHVEAKVEDGKIIIAASYDIIGALEELAAKSDNKIDDALVSMVKAAKDNLDWVGIAKDL